MTQFDPAEDLQEAAPAAAASEPEEATWYQPDGKLYIGEVNFDVDDKPFGETFTCCTKCGGSGKWKRRLACIRCDGEGGKYDQIRLYDEKQNATRQRAKQRKIEKKEAAETEKRANRLSDHYEFVAEHSELFERAEAYQDNKFIASLLSKSEEWGGLTDKQLDAFRQALDRMDEEKTLYANSRHVGAAGDRLDLEVTCRMRTSFFRPKFKGRGTDEVFVTEMIDADGNAYAAITPSFNLRVGEQALIRGTVKAHDERRGWPRTLLARVLTLEIVARPEAPAVVESGQDASIEDDDAPAMGAAA